MRELELEIHTFRTNAMNSKVEWIHVYYEI